MMPTPLRGGDRPRKGLRIPVIGAIALAAGALAGPVGAAESAVVFMYHRFGEGTHPSTNVTVGQLDAHIAELSSGAYTILPLADIVGAIGSGRPLPQRTVGLSVDDAFRSVYTVAWPRLARAALPFTLFVATEPVDRGTRHYMTWDQVRELRDAGVTIGHHGAAHLHMADATLDEAGADLDRSTRRFKEELGQLPDLFAYPYGEAGLTIQDLARQRGFVAAFGQHSGVIGGTSNRFYLPRFALNERFGSLERFRLAAEALPLPVDGVVPADPLITRRNPPVIGFTVTAPLTGLERLACYVSRGVRVRLERPSPTRFEVHVDRPFPAGRTRLNCTLPAIGSGRVGRWHWYGRQYYVPPTG